MVNQERKLNTFMSKLPIYKQLKFYIKEKIDNDEYLPGEAILSERELAKKYGVNRMTVKKALQSLIEDGILYSIPGSGTFVASESKNFMIGIFDDKTFASISSSLQASGDKGFSKIINKSVYTNIKSISKKLNISIDDEIYSLVRQRLNQNSEVIALEYFYTPRKLFNDIDNFDFTRVSLYDYMQKKNLKPTSYKRKLTIEPASSTIAELMNIKPLHFVYCFEFIGYADNHQIVEYTKSYIDTSKIKFEYTISK